MDALLDIMRKRTECIGSTCEEEWSDEVRVWVGVGRDGEARGGGKRGVEC